MTKPPPIQFTLTLVPVPGDSRPAYLRLRTALKALLRAHGLRCTDMREDGPEPPIPTDKATSKANNEATAFLPEAANQQSNSEWG